MSSPVTAPGIAPGSGAATPARHLTEPYRQLGALALLTANAVFLLLGISGLVFVIDGWADGFGFRSAVQFGTFVGPLSLGLPMVALLLATHIAPMVSRSRAILLTVLIQYGVSALFGAITFLGAFAHNLGSVRATVEGLLWRSVWLGLLVVAGIMAVRVLTGLYPPTPPRRYPTYAGARSTSPASPVYGRPYPGQPMYPHATYQPGSADPTRTPAVSQPTALQPTVPEAPTPEPTPSTGWPVVPPPPMPEPLAIPRQPVFQRPVIEPDPTIRVTPLTRSLNGDATQLMPLTPPPAPPMRDIPVQPDSPPSTTDGTAEPPTRESEH